MSREKSGLEVPRETMKQRLAAIKGQEEIAYKPLSYHEECQLAYAYFGHGEYLKAMPEGDTGHEWLEAEDKLRGQWIAAGKPNLAATLAKRPVTYFESGNKYSHELSHQRTVEERGADVNEGYNEALGHIDDALRMGIHAAVAGGDVSRRDEPTESVQEDYLRGFLVGLMLEYPGYREQILDLARERMEQYMQAEKKSKRKHFQNSEPVFNRVIGELTKLVSVKK